MEKYRERSCKIIKNHLENNNGQLYCQALLGCGAVGNTVPMDIPDHKGMEELPTSDSSNPGIVIGAALAGRRPIYVVRYQGFLSINLWTIAQYAAKSKEMWQTPCPLFIRAISMTGSIGPVASNYHHSSAARYPGIVVKAPMTAKELQYTWNYFMSNDNVVLCSESRKAFNIDYELDDLIDFPSSDITLIGIGDARLECIKAAEELNKEKIATNVLNLVDLKPLLFKDGQLDCIKNSRLTIIVDGDYEICGISEHIAYTLLSKYGFLTVKALGLQDRSAGFSPLVDNVTPTSNQIMNFVKKNL